MLGRDRSPRIMLLKDAIGDRRCQSGDFNHPVGLIAGPVHFRPLFAFRCSASLAKRAAFWRAIFVSATFVGASSAGMGIGGLCSFAKAASACFHSLL